MMLLVIWFSFRHSCNDQGVVVDGPFQLEILYDSMSCTIWGAQRRRKGEQGRLQSSLCSTQSYSQLAKIQKG